MSSSTTSTSWPATAVPSSFKNVIKTFFSLLDDSSGDVGDKLADQIFTKDGVLHTPTGTASGSCEIRKCREHAWTVVKGRRHSVKKVYAHDADATDLLLIGLADISLVNGNSVTQEFVARVWISSAELGDPKIKLYQVWTDSAPMTKALQAD